MPDLTSAPTFTDSAIVTAHAKLPDDISMDELSALVAAITSLDQLATLTADLEEHRQLPTPPAVDQTVVRRVQYGSDFMVVLAIAGSAGAVWVALAKGLDFLAGGFLKYQQALSERDARLARRAERARAEDTLEQGRLAQLLTAKRKESFELRTTSQLQVERARSLILPNEQRRELEQLMPPLTRGRDRAVTAISQLAEYGVRLDVRYD